MWSRYSKTLVTQLRYFCRSRATNSSPPTAMTAASAL